MRFSHAFVNWEIIKARLSFVLLHRSGVQLRRRRQRCQGPTSVQWKRAAPRRPAPPPPPRCPGSLGPLPAAAPRLLRSPPPRARPPPHAMRARGRADSADPGARRPLRAVSSAPSARLPYRDFGVCKAGRAPSLVPSGAAAGSPVPGAAPRGAGPANPARGRRAASARPAARDTDRPAGRPGRPVPRPPVRRRGGTAAPSLPPAGAATPARARRRPVPCRAVPPPPVTHPLCINASPRPRPIYPFFAPPPGQSCAGGASSRSGRPLLPFLPSRPPARPASFRGPPPASGTTSARRCAAPGGAACPAASPRHRRAAPAAALPSHARCCAARGGRGARRRSPRSRCCKSVPADLLRRRPCWGGGWAARAGGGAGEPGRRGEAELLLLLPPHARGRRGVGPRVGKSAGRRGAAPPLRLQPGRPAGPRHGRSPALLRSARGAGERRPFCRQPGAGRPVGRPPPSLSPPVCGCARKAPAPVG